MRGGVRCVCQNAAFAKLAGTECWFAIAGPFGDYLAAFTRLHAIEA